MTSKRINTGYPAAYGPDTLFAVPPAERSDDARPTWWASRRGSTLLFSLPTQALHDANRRAAKADPHGAAPFVHDREITTNASTEIAANPAKDAEHERCL